jgi:hypothetical protein
MPPNSKLNAYYSMESHIPVQLRDGLAQLPLLMLDPQYAVRTYTRLPLGEKIPISQVSAYSGLFAEAEGSWLHGDEGILAIDCSSADLSQDVILYVTAMPLINDKHLRQRILLNASGHALPPVVFEKSGDNTIEIVLPSDLLQENQGKILLSITALDAVTPKSIGAWDYDADKISIFLKNITMAQPSAN